MPKRYATRKKLSGKARGKVECHPPGLTVRCCVYTPPGFRANGKAKYPALYLLHGVRDTEREWDRKAGLSRMLDGLIARKKLRKLVVVLPFGFLSEAEQTARTFPDSSKFDAYLCTQLMPAVEPAYSIDSGRRAIAGISMGGRQALETGFAHPDRFVMIGGFSSAIQDVDVLSQLPPSESPPPVYLRCGLRDDRLYKLNGDLVGELAARGFPCDPAEAEGLDGPDRPEQR